MELLDVVTLLGIGVLGGVWNAVAGGATLFTFPALMAAGLPPLVANATNYVALLPSNAAALPAYRCELRQVGRALWPLVIVSGLGAIVGSVLLLFSDPAVFERLIPALILTATALFAFGDQIRAKLLHVAGGTRTGSVVYLGLFVASIYGGYFGAGLGIILLGIAQIMGYSDFHVANAIKNLLASSFSLLSIIVFGVGGLIAWPQAFAMMAGSTVGGYLGGTFAKYINPQLLRGAVILFGVVLSGVYAWRAFA